ncbi:4264_t:CDS:1, partial [Dentiscutata heterogama]
RASFKLNSFMVSDIENLLKSNLLHGFGYCNLHATSIVSFKLNSLYSFGYCESSSR